MRQLAARVVPVASGSVEPRHDAEALKPHQDEARHAGQEHEADGGEDADLPADHHEARDLDQRQEEDEETEQRQAHGSGQV